MKEMNIYESLFEHNTDLIFKVNLNGIIEDVNSTVRVVTGYSLYEMINKPFLELLHMENREKSLFLNNLSTSNLEFRVNLKTANHAKISCLLKTIPIFIQDEITSYFVVLKDMRKLDKEVYIEEPFNYKSITENVLDVIIIMDEHKNYLYVSPSSKEMFGFDYENMNDYEAYFNIYPDHVPKLNASYENALATGEPFDLDVQARHKDRGWIWTKIVGKAIYDEFDQFKHMFLIARDISKEKEIEEELKFYAYHDSLTNIPNRRYYIEQLLKQIEHLNETGNEFAVAILDIDNFKLINDSYGHEIGDAVIQEFANRLEQLMIDKGIVARLGGDEFVLLINNIDVVKHIYEFAQSIHQAMKTPFTVQATHLNITTSVGLTLCNRKGLNPSIILRTVDGALYEVKRSGKSKTIINTTTG